MGHGIRSWFAAARRLLEITFVNNPRQWLIEAFGGGRAVYSKITVTPATALQSPAVFSPVRVAWQTLSTLPLITYERLADGARERAPQHPLYALLHDAPNDEMTAQEFRGMLQIQWELRHNAYAEIVRDGAGRVVELWPLIPDRVRIERDANGALVYYVALPEGMRMADGTREARLPRDRVLHIRGMIFDGVRGTSPIGLMPEAIGLALATEAYGAGFFGSNSVPGGALKFPRAIRDDKMREKMRAEFEELHMGLSRAHRVAILDDGADWVSIGMQNDHAQFLQTRQFQLAEIGSRMFGLQAHKYGDLTHATFTNIEHQGIEFVTDFVRPRCVIIEQAMMMALLTPRERQRFFVEHLLDGLLRGDIQTRYNAYAVGRSWGWLSANDVRRKENDNPIAGGDQYLVPANMRPADAPWTPDPGPKTARELPRGIRLALTGLAEDAIARIVRKEAEAVRRAAERHASNGASWAVWLHEFYAEHAVFVARTLRLDLATADAYAAAHRGALATRGLAIAENWEQVARAELRHHVQAMLTAEEGIAA